MADAIIVGKWIIIIMNVFLEIIITIMINIKNINITINLNTQIKEN